MAEKDVLVNLINNNISEVNRIIDSLYTTTNPCQKNTLLNQLRKNISNIEMLVEGLNMKQNSDEAESIKMFTPEELSIFNGKNGNPAYVAVNGIVYDVTDIASWAAATHFGLTAGKDVTSEFTKCHAGQPVLSKLKVVGKMSR